MPRPALQRLDKTGNRGADIPVSIIPRRAATTRFGDWGFPVLLVLGSWVCILILMWNTAVSLPHIWSQNSAYSHCYLILPIVAWLIWERRGSLSATAPKPSFWGIAAIVLATAAWLAAQIVSIQVASQLALVAMIEASALALIGPGVCRLILFPAFFLYFIVPFGDEVTPSLQKWTADISVWALRASGVPVWQDGFQIMTPEGNFVVANECAGLRFFIATIALSMVVANQFYSSWIRRGAFIALAVVIPIFANGLRGYTVILLADTIGLSFAASIDHVVYGWVFLSLVTFVLLAIGWSFRELGLAHIDAGSQTPIAARWPLAAPLVAVVVIGIVAAGAWIDGRRNLGAVEHIDTSAALPSYGLTRITGSGLSWRPELPGADVRYVDTFSFEQHEVTRAVGFYLFQRQGAKASLDEWLLAGPDWTRNVIDERPLSLGAQHILARRVIVTKNGEGRLIVAWIWIGHRFTGSEFLAKLVEVLSLFSGDSHAAVIVVSVPFAPGESEGNAETVLDHFLKTQSKLGTAMAGIPAQTATSPTSTTVDR